MIDAEHKDADTIAQWKDQINEMWVDLLELIETRTQHLAASWERHKFFHDCTEVLERIHVSPNLISVKTENDYDNDLLARF